MERGFEEHPVLSVLMPVYNERGTVQEAVEQLEKSGPSVPFELVAVDDGSTDGTAEILADLAVTRPWMRPVTHGRNQGKGAAIRTALDHAAGEYVCIYDADLEYDPADIGRLLEPVLNRESEVVYGVRQFGGHAAHSYWYVMGNRLVTTVTNVLFNCYLRDVMTCYKVLPRRLALDLDIRSSGFDMEAEITGKLLAGGHRIGEVAIGYRARSHEQGKKLRSTDAMGVLATLVRLRAARRCAT